MNPLRSHKNVLLVYVCQSAVWMLYQFLQYLQWRGQVAYKVLHAVCLQQTSAAAGKEFPGASGEVWAVQSRCWDPHGNQNTQSGRCHWQWEPHQRAPSRRALPQTKV